VPTAETTPAPQDEQTSEAVGQSDSTGAPLPVAPIPTQQLPAAAPTSEPDLPDRIMPMPVDCASSVPEYTPLVLPCAPLGPPDSGTSAPLGTNDSEAIHLDAPTEPDLSIRPPHSDPLAQPCALPSLDPMPVLSGAPTAMGADPQLPSTIARASQVKTQKKYLRSGKMQPGDSVTARLVK
jgi:hypothetical protein